MTLVVNMLGGSGVGKSTTAAGLYYHMKLAHENVELVREYVKLLAWQGIKPGQYDQVNIFGEQCKLEHSLYGKVDYIITDSPIVLAPIYEVYYHGDSMMEEAAIKLLSKSAANEVQQLNIILERTKDYDEKGRYQTLEQAKEVDKMVVEFLDRHGMSYHRVGGPDEDRAQKIMELIKNERKET